MYQDGFREGLQGGRQRCWGRFFGHFDILRFTTRGFERFRRGSIRSAASSDNSRRYHDSKLSGSALTHSGNRACKIRKQPVNDKRSTSSPTLVAASSISERTTK
jgi:hypothetical protein